MPFEKDLSTIKDIVFHRDTACAESREKFDAPIWVKLDRLAKSDDSDAFLLEAMKVLAIAGNGHTRIIPNAGISVWDMRFVSIGGGVYLTKAPVDHTSHIDSEVLAINDIAIDDVFQRARPFLAGTPARQRAIFPILLAWPAALMALGCYDCGQPLSISLRSPSGQVHPLTLSAQPLVPADSVYPVREHGWPDAERDPDFVMCERLLSGVQYIRLTEFHCPDDDTLDRQLAQAAGIVSGHSHDDLILDLRGNRGGSFLKALPLLDVLHSTWRGATCAVLIDKFTFSAAIVFVALLFDRLQNRMCLIGEEMGDSLRFHAEGDLVQLAQTGAVLRFSDVFHDWDTGTADATTPPEIRKWLVAAHDMPEIHRVDSSAIQRREGPDPCLHRALTLMAAR